MTLDEAARQRFGVGAKTDGMDGIEGHRPGMQGERTDAMRITAWMT